MDRNSRQNKILDLIETREIETQSELCAALRQNGFAVTQATVSRDVQELGLTKVVGSGGKKRYVRAEGAVREQSPNIRNLFRECVVALRPVQNLLLVKTLSGNASTAGMVIDRMELSEVAGTVAGDDTLLVVCETREQAAALAQKLDALRH